MGVSPVIPVPLPHAAPVFMQYTLRTYGSHFPCRTAIGVSLGATSAIVAARRRLVLVAPVLDPVLCLSRRARTVRQHLRWVYFALSMRDMRMDDTVRVHRRVEDVTGELLPVESEELVHCISWNLMLTRSAPGKPH